MIDMILIFFFTIIIILLIGLNFIYHAEYKYGKSKLTRLVAGDTIQDDGRLLRVVEIPIQVLREEEKVEYSSCNSKF